MNLATAPFQPGARVKLNRPTYKWVMGLQLQANTGTIERPDDRVPGGGVWWVKLDKPALEMFDCPSAWTDIDATPAAKEIVQTESVVWDEDDLELLESES